MKMKRGFGVVIVAAAAVLLLGCDIFLGPPAPVGKGSLVIGFGEGEARSALSDEVLAALRYELALSGPGGERISASLSAGETFNRQVALGEWRIEADAFSPENIRIGAGTATVTVRAGANQARIPMRMVSATDTVVNALALDTLVTAPVKDAAPVTTEIDAVQYTGTITWQKSDGSSFSGNFAAATVYQALLSLTVKPGFTFSGVPADSFIYSGATVNNAAGSGASITVTISFPETAGGTGNQDISLGFNDDGSGVFSESSFIVKQNGTSAEQSKTIALSGTWASREWRVDGVVKDTGQNFTVNATDYTVGSHTLQVTVGDGDNHQWSKTLPFTVTAAVTEVSLNKTSLSLLVNGTETLYAAVVPANAENRSVSWASSDTAIATVDNGVVTGVSAGTATITATTTDGGHTATCTVTVTAAGSGDITLGFADNGSGAFSQDTFTVSKGGTPASQTITLLETWSSQEWRVDGVVKDTGQNFTVNATDYTVGGHSLQVTVYNGSTPWSKTLQFTVTE
jgi:uncharacterized protein YjdB